MEMTNTRKIYWIAEAFEDGERCDDCYYNSRVEGGDTGEWFRECDILEGRSKDYDVECRNFVPHTVYVERADGSEFFFDCLAFNEEHAIELYDLKHTTQSDDVVSAEAQ